MRRTLIFLLIFTVLIAVFALQNSGEVVIKLWFWSIQTSLVLVLILTFAFGAVAGILFSLPGWSRRTSKKKAMEPDTEKGEEDVEEDVKTVTGKGEDPEFEDVKR